MFDQVGGKFVLMTQPKLQYFVALLTFLPFLATPGLAQIYEETKVHSGVALDATTGHASAPTESSYSKDYLETLTTTALADLLQKCADGLMNNTDCTALRSENFRRTREKDRPVDIETIKPESPFGGIDQSVNGELLAENPTSQKDKDEKRREIPTLEELRVTPPDSHTVATDSDTVVTVDPRDIRDRNRDKPPSIIPTFDRSGKRNSDRSESKSEGK